MASLFDRLICSYLVICERILNEQDGVLSPIRLVDIFFAQPQANSPPLPETVKPAVLMALLFVLKATPEAVDDTVHKFSLRLIRPDGEVTNIGEPITFKIEKPKIPGSHSGMNVGIPQIGVFTKQKGLHYFVADIDGREVTRSPFILTEQQLGTQR